MGDREGAHALAEAATQLAGSFESSAWSAMAASTVASAAAADGDLLAARERFQYAALLYEKVGHTFWATWTRAQLNTAGTVSSHPRGDGQGARTSQRLR